MSFFRDALWPQLGRLASIYVNDAFGAAHRAHASTEGVTHYMMHSVAGKLMEVRKSTCFPMTVCSRRDRYVSQKELTYLNGVMEHPNRPLCAIIGGAKVSSKIGVVQSLLRKCDKVLIGGGMAFTFLKVQVGCL